jgi:hypothetical protein
VSFLEAGGKKEENLYGIKSKNLNLKIKSKA